MKKKNKFFISIIFGLVLLLSGCPSDKYVLFGDNLDDNNIAYGESANINLTFQPPEEYKYYRVFVESNGNIVNSSSAPCEAIPTSTPKRVSYKLESTKVGDQLRLRVYLYANNQCKATQTHSAISEVSNEYTVVSSEATKNVARIINDIGGKSQYCNIDSNGNYIISESTNNFVNIAYSQIGYTLSSSKSNLAQCTGGKEFVKIGKPIYSKYGTDTNFGLHSLTFVNWVASKAKLKNIVNRFNSIEELVSWAQRTDRYFTDVKKLRDGDLVIFDHLFIHQRHPIQKVNDPRGVGVAYIDSRKVTSAISLIANTSDNVYEVYRLKFGADFSTYYSAIGFIKLSGISY